MSLTISAFSVFALRCGKMRHRVRKCQISGFCCCYPKEISIWSPSSCNLRCKVGSPRCFLMLCFQRVFECTLQARTRDRARRETRNSEQFSCCLQTKHTTCRQLHNDRKVAAIFFRVCCKTFISLLNGCKQNYYFCSTKAVFQQFSRWHGSLVSMTSELDRMARKSLPLSRFWVLCSHFF